MKQPTQQQLFEHTRREPAEINLQFIEMLHDKTAPLTRDELISLIKKRPELWGRFSRYIDNYKWTQQTI